MQTIGERLEEARKKRGLALRDISETTKIRTEYLRAMEENSMDIPLPEIYRRGFLKSYARFLKLDAEGIAQEYDDLRAKGQISKASREPVRKTLGTFSLTGHDPNLRAAQSRVDMTHESDHADAAPAHGTLPFSQQQIIKAIYIAGGFAAIALLIWIISSVFSGKQDPATPTDSQVQDYKDSIEIKALRDATYKITFYDEDGLRSARPVESGVIIGNNIKKIPFTGYIELEIGRAADVHLRIKSMGQGYFTVTSSFIRPSGDSKPIPLPKAIPSTR